MDDIILNSSDNQEEVKLTEVDVFLNREAEELMRMFMSCTNNTIAKLKTSSLLMEEELVPALNHCVMQATFNFLTNMIAKYAKEGYEQEFINDLMRAFQVHCTAFVASTNEKNGDILSGATTSIN